MAFGLLAVVLLASALASALVKRTFHSVMFLGVFLVGVAGLYILLGSPLVGIIQILVYVGGILTLFVFAVMFVAGDETEATEATPAMRPRSPAWPTLAAVFVALAALYLAMQFTGRVNTGASNLLGGSTAAQLAGFAAGLLFVVLLAISGLVAWLGARHAIDQWSGARLFGTLVAALLFGLLMSLVAQAAGAWAPAHADGTAVANDVGAVVDALFGAQVIPFEVLGVLLTAVLIGALVIARPLGVPPDSDRYTVAAPDVAEQSASAPPQASDPALAAPDAEARP